MPLVPVMPVSPRRSSGWPIEIAGGQGQRLPAVLHLDPAARRASGGSRSRSLRRRLRGPARRRELAAVRAAARESEEQESLADAPRIVLQAVDRQGGQAPAEGAGAAGRPRVSRRVSSRKPDADAFSFMQDGPGAGDWIRAMPLPAGTTVKPLAAASASTARMLIPRKFGTFGPAGLAGVAEAGASSSLSSSIFGSPEVSSASARSSRSASLATRVLAGGSSGRSLGTSSTRSASAATAWKTGAATTPPNPPSPWVPFSVTTTTMAGFVTGANPMKDPLYVWV